MNVFVAKTLSQRMSFPFSRMEAAIPSGDFQRMPTGSRCFFACLPGLFLLSRLVLIQGKDIDCRGLSLSQCPSNEYLGSKIGQQVQRNGATILANLTSDALDVKIAAVILPGPAGHRTSHQEGGRLKHFGSGLASLVLISCLPDKVVGCYSPCGKLSYSIHGR